MPKSPQSKQRRQAKGGEGKLRHRWVTCPASLSRSLAGWIFRVPDCWTMLPHTRLYPMLCRAGHSDRGSSRSVALVEQCEGHQGVLGCGSGVRGISRAF